MQLNLSAYPRTVTATDGKFHPAVQQGLAVWYWPNVTFATEELAYERAALSLKDAYDAANGIAGQWNVYKL